MLFNSVNFFLFFLLFFPLYWWSNREFGTSWRNLLTIIFSYIFYAWWDWRFLGLIILSSVIDYVVGRSMASARRSSHRKLLLAISILTNLGMLGLFKYYNFFAEGFATILQSFGLSLSWTSLQIILPVGISFYTFQTLSYTIDIYRRQIQPTKDGLAFFAFVSFFPQLVAGPIERAGKLLPYFQRQLSFDYAYAVSGLRLLLWGLFKKMVIADNAGVLVDLVYNGDVDGSGLLYLAATLLFAMQIYGDFSGYSDMAMGLARLLGIELMQNFRTPYFSNSFINFWRRWHISLSTWFRDYVYIPLGGNQGPAWRVNINIFLTFLLSGLWHGAQITFVIWGSLHGLLLILEKSILQRRYKVLNKLFVFSVVSLLWIPFRANDTSQMLDIFESITRLFDYRLSDLDQFTSVFSDVRLWAYGFTLTAFVIIEASFRKENFSQWINRYTRKIRITGYYLLVLLLLFLGNFSTKPTFIYFQF